MLTYLLAVTLVTSGHYGVVYFLQQKINGPHSRWGRDMCVGQHSIISAPLFVQTVCRHADAKDGV